MFGPKSRPTSSRIGTGSCSSSLKRAPSSASTAAAQRQASQSSLLASGKSTSRSSIVSDTGVSVCSATSQQNRTTTTKTTGSSGSLIGRTTVGGAVAVVARRPSTSRTTTNPNGTTTTTIINNNSRPSATSTTRASSIVSSISSSTTGSKSASQTSGSSSSLSSRRPPPPTLAMSLRDKDQQIKLLIKERDEQKFQAELMAQKAEEWEDKFQQSELERSHVTSEADDEVVELRRLAQELEDENRRLAEKVGEREQVVSDIQFKLEELDIERGELKRELEDKEALIISLEQEQREISQGKPVAQVNTERAQSRVKYEREIEELKERLTHKEEQMIQLRTSLEMRKNEVANLQAHVRELECKLKIESERNERHLKRIDEINLELKAAEVKLATKTEGNEMYEKQVRQLRQELRLAEEKLEQISLARKKDVDILHNKLSAVRRGSTTPTSPQPYKTPTPQDEIVRLQMELRDLKDQLIDREAELDCNRRDMEVMRRKMETRTLEVDCNNQELARRCQDLLEQNRQSEETVKQLLKSTTEHSAQLMRATEDLKEANGKCVKLRDEINELESKLEDEMRKSGSLIRDNGQLKDENDDYKEQVEMLRRQVDSLNEQLRDLCEQLDVQTNCLHKDREALANQLSQNEIDSAQVRHDLATAKQDLRTSRLQTQEVVSERDRLKCDLEIKEKYIASRNDLIETIRHELEDCRKSLAEHKQRIEELRQTGSQETDRATKELRSQLESLKRNHQVEGEEKVNLQIRCDQLETQLEEVGRVNEEEELRRFDEMRRKHSAELDELKLKITDLETQLEEAKSSTLKRVGAAAAAAADSGAESRASTASDDDNDDDGDGSDGTTNNNNNNNNNINDVKANSMKNVSQQQQQQQQQQSLEDYETQIEFLNSVVVDMQRKCDDYKNRLAQMETLNIMNEFDNLILSNKPIQSSRASTLRRNGTTTNTTTTTTNDKLTTATGTLTRSSNSDNKPSRLSGRPYCDICSVYDLHHTMYCPKVSEKLLAAASSRPADISMEGGNNNINNNNNNNNNINNYNNNIRDSSSHVDELFREYEQSLQEASIQQFSSLRRPTNVSRPPRPYCDHCDLFGHTIKSCNSLRV